MASVMSTVLSRLNAFLDSELEQVLCFDSAIDAEKFASEKSAIFLILPEEDTTKNFMAGLIIQNLSRELFAVADENDGKLQNRVVLYCDEFGTMPPFDVLPLFSAGRSRRLTLVPIIQSLAQLEKNYGKEGRLFRSKVLCFDSAIDAEKFASEKSAIFLILPEEDTTKNFMAGLIIQNLSRELFAVADENDGKLQNRVVLYCDEFGTMPPFDVLPLFSAGRSRRLTLVPIIQSLAQLEKNYGKEGSEIIQDNCQDTIFGGFAPNSQTAEVLSKALGNRTVLSGSVSRGKNDPSQSLQMMERALLTPDELKSIPKGNFIVQKTGQHPMRTRLRLFLEWGITFEEPYIVSERTDRAVAYANREDLERNLPQSSKAEDTDVSGAYAVSKRGGMAHEPAVEKPRRRGGKQMKTYGEEDL